MRYFRAVSATTYEAIRAELDAVWDYPQPDRKTITSIPPAAVAVSDSLGRVYLAASAVECDYPAISDRLPQLLASGAVEEISEAEYRAALPSVPTR